MRFEGRKVVNQPDWLARQTQGMNRLIYGDNFDTMTRSLMKDSVDLIYLDPPFNSDQNYNVVYSKKHNTKVPEQVHAFSDTWTLDPAKEELARSMPLLMRQHGIDDVYIELWKVWMHALRSSQPKLLSYLVYMVQRLILMRSILRPTGSIYFHCDPTVSHYIKVMMDAIFGHENFRNEIIWKRTSAHNSSRKWGEIHDVILFYSKTRHFTWNLVEQETSGSYLNSKYKYADERGQYRWSDVTAPGIRETESGAKWRGFSPTAEGRHWAIPNRLKDLLAEEGYEPARGTLELLDQLYDADLLRFAKSRAGGQGRPEVKRYQTTGQPVQDIISDIAPLNSQSKERLGYPTQKPQALIERIIRASSNPGDVVFDPFVGCGSTLLAAQNLERNWIGCEIAMLPLQICKRALKRRGLKEGEDFAVLGVPTSIDEANQFARVSPSQFSNWIVEFVGGFPVSRVHSDQVDGYLFDGTADSNGALPIAVRTSLRKPDIDDIASLAEQNQHQSGVAVISITKPSDVAIQIINDHNSRLTGSNAGIQVLWLDDIVLNNKRFIRPSQLGHRYPDEREPAFL